MFKGSVLSIENKPQLIKTRAILSDVKDTKLALRHERNKNHSWDKKAAFDHLVSEVYELQDAINHLEIDDILNEIADISNMADILAMIYLDERRRQKTAGNFLAWRPGVKSKSKKGLLPPR